MPSGDNLAAVDQVNSLLTGESPQTVVDDEPKREDETETIETESIEAEEQPVADDSPDGEDETDEDAPETDESEEQQPVTLKELAEALEVDTKELYGVEFPMGGGETATLGELKDAYKAHQQLIAEREDYEEKKLASEQEMMIANRQMQQLMTMGVQNKTFTPEMLDLANKIHQETMRRENKLLLIGIPEWQNETTRSKEYDAMIEHIAPYDLSEADLKAVGNHKWMKVLNDAVRYRNRVKEAANGGRKKPTRQVKAKSAAPHSSKMLREKIDAVHASQNLDKQATAANQILEGKF